MFGIQYLSFALLIAGQGLAAAVPSVPAEDLGMPEAREEYNRVRGLYNPGTQTYPTRSGYPHEFSNFGGTIKFDDTACNSKKRPVKIYEFPIYQRASEGHEASHYDANKKKDEQPGPGECRVVFTAENGHLCGVMCHKSMTPGGDQAFIKCTA
ncbi:hypothetical protein BKA56DRAFT_622531 [Ilyonectria sp. MPI-CAGE-AT-0026]|nr:hypothetical protein BKA56DRAFT_622531 [Ilyonectria sp. MPI-CAGE-AT-0026]